MLPSTGCETRAAVFVVAETSWRIFFSTGRFDAKFTTNSSSFDLRDGRFSHTTHSWSLFGPIEHAEAMKRKSSAWLHLCLCWTDQWKCFSNSRSLIFEMLVQTAKSASSLSFSHTCTCWNEKRPLWTFLLSIFYLVFSSFYSLVQIKF